MEQTKNVPINNGVVSSFLERVKDYLEENGISSRQFGLSIGKSESYLGNTIKQGSSPSVQIITKIIAKYPDLDIRWALTGERGEASKQWRLSEEGAVYEKKRGIDEIIDERIDTKLDGRMEKLQETLKEVILGMIDDEIAKAQAEISKKSK